MNEKQFKQAKDYLKANPSITNVARGTAYWKKYLLSRMQNLIIFFNTEEKNFNAWEYMKNKIIKGYVVAFEKNGTIWTPFEANAYGFDAYFVPNKVVYGNPVLGSGSLKAGENCVICWNTDLDKMAPGTSIIWETIERYARMLAELESTFANSLIYTRAGLLAQANNSTTAKAFDEILNKIRVGDVSTVMNPTMAFDSLQMFNLNTNTSFTTYCEARDYLINCFMNSIGLQTIEEKKERMIEAEVENAQENDVLKNNIDIMFKCTCESIDEINEMFGTNIIVKKNVIVG